MRERKKTVLYFNFFWNTSKLFIPNFNIKQLNIKRIYVKLCSIIRSQTYEHADFFELH